MRAMKDVEVGDYYYRRENYKAALSRYREALEFKPRDAVATFKLAQTLEKTKEFEKLGPGTRSTWRFSRTGRMPPKRRRLWSD